jgi:hypothetical protein
VINQKRTELENTRKSTSAGSKRLQDLRLKKLSPIMKVFVRKSISGRHHPAGDKKMQNRKPTKRPGRSSFSHSTYCCRTDHREHSNRFNQVMKSKARSLVVRTQHQAEAATGVDLIVDDTPGHCLSSFDPSEGDCEAFLQRLVADEVIHPARIEEVVEKPNKSKNSDGYWRKG